jgi:hypothetical protein
MGLITDMQTDKSTERAQYRYCKMAASERGIGRGYFHDKEGRYDVREM